MFQCHDVSVTLSFIQEIFVDRLHVPVMLTSVGNSIMDIIAFIVRTVVLRKQALKNKIIRIFNSWDTFDETQVTVTE